MFKKYGESDCVSINYTGFEMVFADLIKNFSKKGLPLDELNYNLLEKLVEFVKSDYKQSCLVCNEMLEIYEKGEINNIKQALLNDFNIVNIKSRKLFNRYESFFNIFDDAQAEEFFSKLDYYMSFMFYVIHNTSFSDEKKQDEYLKQIINNLKEISQLDVNKVYLNFYPNMKTGESVKLYYQPQGFIKDECGRRVFYREENVYSNVHFRSKLETDCVDVTFYCPDFIIKGSRIIGFSLEKSGNFDSKEWEMTLYNMNFNSADLPTLEKLENTMCDLKDYQDLIHMEKLRLFRAKLKELSEKVSDLRLSSEDLISLADELNLRGRFNYEVTPLFTDEELLIMSIAENKNKEKKCTRMKVLRKIK